MTSELVLWFSCGISVREFGVSVCSVLIQEMSLIIHPEILSSSSFIEWIIQVTETYPKLQWYSGDPYKDHLVRHFIRPTAEGKSVLIQGPDLHFIKTTSIILGAYRALVDGHRFPVVILYP